MEKESGLSCIFPFRWGDVGNAVMVSILSFFFMQLAKWPQIHYPLIESTFS